ncbi:uncharacterized protein [Nicotiana tomentosiformis]|uniref:uncharacterized protein n=1 Tax=Nicotiana tomentosiformis TaxID=4098 RepID=UPI00388C9E1E
MVAIAKDGNNQIFPIAWVIVGTEKKDTQRWFMRILQDDLQLGDGTQVTIISDMQKAWLVSLKKYSQLVSTEYVQDIFYQIGQRSGGVLREERSFRVVLEQHLRQSLKPS